MDIRLNKTQLLEFRRVFLRDRLVKGKKKRVAFKVDRLFARLEAVGNSLQIDSGRVDATVRAAVFTPGVIVIRDTLLRSILENLREDGTLHLVCTPDAVVINGASVQLEAGEYAMYHDPACVPKRTVINSIPPGAAVAVPAPAAQPSPPTAD